ncbi:MAG TPA: glycosyltransferase [Steroidobacteraceae bacterium]|jgi:glycosyltransferase involved in cell wall biosynthesis
MNARGSSTESRLPSAAPTHDSRTVVVLHRGGAYVRGTEAVLIRSAKALAAAGFRLVICRRNACIDGSLAAIGSQAEFVDFQFPELMIAGIKETSFPIGAYLKAFFQLRDLVKRSNATFIYCSGGLPCQLAVPVARLARIPVLCHFHHPAIRRAHYLWLSRLVDKRVFPSAFVQQHSQSNPRDTGTVVYNGIDLMRFQPAPSRDGRWRAQWGIAADAVVVGQVAALAPNKRPEFLISAFSPLLKLTDQKFHLCLVGAGPMQESLQRLVKELGMAGHVTLTGYVDDVLPYYQHVFDINVLASRAEGLGISVIEGSACGLPAVVSDCTGLPETILDGETGFLFGVNDAESLRQNLLRLAQSPALRASMGQAGRALSQARFSATSYDEKFMTVVEELLSGEGASQARRSRISSPS